MSFDTLIAGVLKREGGYVNHPADRGAATNMGITQRTYTTWRNEVGIGYLDVRELTRAEAAAIYREHYWHPARCEELPEAVQDIHFDAAVNHGVRRAALLLQEAAQVEQDGHIGKITIGACHAMAPAFLRARYIAARYRFYGQIVNRDRSQLVFVVGWLNRMAEFT
jgi:lysozyme family protein